MRKIRYRTAGVTLTILAMLLCAPFLLEAAALAETSAETPSAAAAAPPVPPPAPLPVNYIHPVFPLLDSMGIGVKDSGEPVSIEATCGYCHDTEYINTHNSHRKDHVQVSCESCHMSGTDLSAPEKIMDDAGLIKRKFVSIREPSPDNCARCHGVIATGQAPLTLPEDFGRVKPAPDTYQIYALTKKTGEIISGQKLSNSYMNLADKDSLAYPWDAHAERLVGCVGCHYAANDPSKMTEADGSLPFLLHDPRRLTISQFLNRPDHNLESASCLHCHDPFAAHKELPYPQRHMERLDCRSCHVPRLYGPAWRTLDQSVLTPSGEPVVTLRGAADENPENYNTVFLTGYRPTLLWEENDEGPDKLAPYNLVTHYEWVTGEKDEAVSLDKLRAAYFQEKAYAPEIAKALDTDGNGRVDSREMRLDTEAKVQIVAKRLELVGVANPRLRSRVVAYKVHHGVIAGKNVAMACGDCHGSESPLSASVPLAGYTTAGGSPSLLDEAGKPLPGSVVKTSDGLVYMRPEKSDAYILGHDRAPWSDSLGLAIFLATLFGIGAHGGLRIYTAKKRHPHHVPMQRVYMYSLYERLWHWLMALSILLLVLTGIEIHWMAAHALFGFMNAVWLHNALAVVLIVNAVLSLFYHLASNNIRQFIPPRANFFQEVIAQTRYYLNGIFVGAPHPLAKTPERKMNPLQQITYMMLLNVLLPFQVVSGLVIWGIAHWPELAAKIGGLSIVTPLHNLGAWLFISFVIAHVYLTTTGHKIFANIQAMLSGYDEIEADPSNTKEKQP